MRIQFQPGGVVDAHEIEGNETMRKTASLISGVVLVLQLAPARASLDAASAETAGAPDPVGIDSMQFADNPVSGRVLYAQLEEGAPVEADYEETAQSEVPLEEGEETYAEEAGEPVDDEPVVEGDVAGSGETRDIDAAADTGETAGDSGAAEEVIYDGADPAYDETGAPKTEAGAESGIYALDEAATQGYDEPEPESGEEAGDVDAGYADAPDPYYEGGGSAGEAAGASGQPPVSPFGAVESGAGE